MLKLIIQSIRQTLLWTLVVGVAYPLVMTLVSQVLFHDQAEGSLVMKNGKIIGSALLAQQFTGTNYFLAATLRRQLRHRAFRREQPRPDQRRAPNQCHQQPRRVPLRQ